MSTKDYERTLKSSYHPLPSSPIEVLTATAAEAHSPKIHANDVISIRYPYQHTGRLLL
jgi:hypothetical protein